MILATVAIMLGFGLLIGFHEAAHMLVSKLFGVKVNKFAIGFGPILFSKKFGETSYELRALPLGGFVQCHGEDPMSTVKRGFFSLVWWKRALIALAGPLASLLLAYIMLCGLGLGQGFSLAKSMARAAGFSYMVLAETTKFLIGKSTTPDASLSGPIMVIKLMAASFKNGLGQFSLVLAVVSLSLGFFNLLPIPALDGGHVFLYLLEGIRGKKFKPNTYAIWNLIGTVLLIGLMVFTVFSDILRLK